MSNSSDFLLDIRPQCKHERSRVLYRINDYSVVECEDCGFRKTHPIPAFNSIEEIYNKRFYFGDQSRRFRTIPEMIVRFFRFFRAFKIFIFYRPKRILDVGCGRGLMLFYLKKYFKATFVLGTQFSDPAIKYAREKLGLEVRKGDLREFFKEIPNNLDMISFWHVLEHIDDVEAYICISYELLRKGGRLLIEVPNSESFSQRLTGKSWIGWDLPNHLTHFTNQSLTKLLTEHGFTITKKRYFSSEYSIFMTMQSFLNKISGQQNLFYNFLCVGGVGRRSFSEFIAHALLAIVLLPLAFVANVILGNTRHGEVIHFIAHKP
ncbi:MAG: class I SAM-dependent methyltransferase [Candidatus Omnitrophica bacterium]|nr:class I SAM-dependent methyltransferase [Candidatus Omnitrophota bacterium]